MYFKKHTFIILFIISTLVPAIGFSNELVITDQLGRKVSVPDNPQRVISFAPSITEIVFALGQEKRLTAVTTYSNYPEKAKTYPRVGSYVHLDLEKIVSLHPDLCIATKDGNPKSIIARLEKLHIPVYTVDPRNLNSIIKTVQDLGILLNANNQAHIITRHMRSRINNVKNKIEETNHKPKVFFQIGVSPIISAGTDTFIHELIILAGGINLAQGKSSYPHFSVEQIISLSPDIFIFQSMTNTYSTEKLKQKWTKYQQIPAVKNNRLYHVDSDIFDRPTPRLFDALEILAALIHPEVFENKK